MNSSVLNPTSRLTVVGLFIIGVTHRADAAETIVPGVELMLENLHSSACASMKVPVTVTVLPPATGPQLGCKEETTMSGRT